MFIGLKYVQICDKFIQVLRIFHFSLRVIKKIVIISQGLNLLFSLFPLQDEKNNYDNRAILHCINGFGR